MMSRNRLNEITKQITNGILNGTYKDIKSVPVGLAEEFQSLSTANPPKHEVDLSTLNRLIKLTYTECSKTGENRDALYDAFNNTRKNSSIPYKTLEALTEDFTLFISNRNKLTL